MQNISKGSLKNAQINERKKNSVNRNRHGRTFGTYHQITFNMYFEIDFIRKEGIKGGSNPFLLPNFMFILPYYLLQISLP